jgi:hypothetical protein
VEKLKELRLVGCFVRGAPGVSALPDNMADLLAKARRCPPAMPLYSCRDGRLGVGLAQDAGDDIFEHAGSPSSTPTGLAHSIQGSGRSKRQTGREEGT